MTEHIAVLMGGWSAEREVSLATGAAVVKVLKDSGYDVAPIDVQRDMATLMTRLYPKPTVVFNALHGRYGEDGCVQGLLDILDIPYTHSGLLASALAMDKVMAKRLFKEAGIAVADHQIATSEQVLAGDVMPKPFVIKPVNEGSSIGVHIVRDGDNTPIFSGSGWPFGDNVMVETFIEGRELTVAVMGDRPLVVTEISTGRGFYDYDAKYEEGGSVHVHPADLSPDLTAEVLSLALVAHQTLGCRGISRSDFRFDGNDIYILETNTQPGLTPTSLLPEQAAHVGISFKELIIWMIENAECDS